MDERPVLRSRANPLVKRFRAVRAGKHPDRALLEGERLGADALSSGLELEALLIDAERYAASPHAGHPAARPADRSVLEAVSDLTHAPDHVALAAAPAVRAAGSLAVGPRSLLVVLADVSDPGNLGACARAAEAGGATALGLAGRGASPANPKALRGSMGSLLRLPLLRVEGASELAALGWRQVVAATRGGADPRTFDWSGPVALWLTGETGRAELDAPAEPVTLPMAGAAESLNVAVAAALLVFASGRVDDPAGDRPR
jgi:TrmH family RNA methyltransferase